MDPSEREQYNVDMEGISELTNASQENGNMEALMAYLVSGAMWGYASPWWVQPESENVFTFQNSFSAIRMEFEEGAEGPK